MKSLVPSIDVFDYGSPTVVEDIKVWASESPSQPLTLAWDCHATVESGKICAAAMSTSEKGHYRSLLNVPEEAIKSVNPMVDSGYTFAYTAIGEAFDKTWHVPASEEDFEFAKAFWELSRELLAQGRIIPVKPDINRGGSGLEGVLVGLEELRKGRVSGTKLVYTL